MSSLRRSACSLLVLLVAAGCGDDGSAEEATDASTGTTGGDGTSMGTTEPSTTAPTTDPSTTIDSASAGEDSTSGATSTSSATESGSTGTSSATGTSSTSSTSSTGETGTGSTGSAELGPYGDCVGEMLPCPEGSFCLLVPQTGVCTPEDCTQASDCPEPPPGGDAPVICLDANGDDVDDCRIDCSKGQTCPTGMECFSEEICVWS